LAQDVYANTQLSYDQGASSLLEVTEAESSLHDAQNNYFDKLLSLYDAQLDLEQAKGTLISFLEHIQ